MQEKVNNMIEYMHENRIPHISDIRKSKDEAKFIDYTYIAIIYLSLIKQLNKNIGIDDDSKIRKYNTSTIVVFKKDIIDNAIEIIRESLNNILIDDLNKIIIEYIACGSDIVYV